MELTPEEVKTLSKLLDKAGDKLRTIADDEDATKLADGCDHWLELLETRA